MSQTCLGAFPGGEEILLIVITVARKPLVGSVASNIALWGVGGLNIDACRLKCSESDIDAARVPMANFGPSNSGDLPSFRHVGRRGDMFDMTQGRWPANIILQHAKGCSYTGATWVKSSDRPNSGGGKSSSNLLFGSHSQKHSKILHGNSDGKESIPDWHCVEGCPCKGLKEDSGECPSTLAGRAPAGFKYKHPCVNAVRQGLGMFPRRGLAQVYADTGGASRFFKQVKE